MNEAKTLAIQILAESQIRGDIGKKYASYFIRLLIFLTQTIPTVGLFIYLLMMLATSTWRRRIRTVNSSNSVIIIKLD